MCHCERAVKLMPVTVGRESSLGRASVSVGTELLPHPKLFARAAPTLVPEEGTKLVPYLIHDGYMR